MHQRLADVYPAAKADLATAFVERCLEYCAPGSSTALVTPQNWLFLGSYKALRERLLRQATWDVVAKLGPGAFETISGGVVNVALLIHTAAPPAEGHELVGLDASRPRVTSRKASLLLTERVGPTLQSDQLANPDARIAFEETRARTLLSQYAVSYWGQDVGDSPRFYRRFWEAYWLAGDWSYLQSSVSSSLPFGGREQVVYWQNGCGVLMEVSSELRDIKGHRGIRPLGGRAAWGKPGVAVSLMSLKATLYSGDIYDRNCAALIPKSEADLAAIWAYCVSEGFHDDVRRIDQGLKVMSGALTKVPFQLDHWQKVAAEEYPNGLPEPHSDDPTQWLFKGHPKGSTDPLQVAVARLLGYRWPDQDPDELDHLADADGIVCLPAVRGETPASDRLLELLRAAHGPEWSPALLDRLLTESGSKPGTTLDDWLRNAFFEQHYKKFHQRPFIWHIWDGHKDGFACLVNYHKLDHRRLESLTYSYLPDWNNAQAAAAKAGKTGADLRLAAAQALQAKLKLILAGEPPYDIFVRWKPLAEQPIGWHPDLNDGVRLNIRPFMEAGILRKNPNIKWTKDRSNEPKRDKDLFPWFWDGDTFTGERVNDKHLTVQEKQAARRHRQDE
jgi:hypothetical protein